MLSNYTKEDYDKDDLINYDEIVLEILSVLQKNELRFYQAENVLDKAKEQLQVYKII